MERPEETVAERLVAAAARWAARLGGAVILAAAALVAAEVVLRNAFGIAALNSFELTNYGFAAAVAFGLAFALTQRAHIRIDVVYGRFPLPVRAIADALAMVGLAATAVTMSWFAWRVVAASLRLGAVSNSPLAVPLAIPQAIWAAGLSFFALVALALSMRAVALLMAGRLTELHREAGIRSETVPILASDRREDTD